MTAVKRQITGPPSDDETLAMDETTPDELLGSTDDGSWAADVPPTPSVDTYVAANIPPGVLSDPRVQEVISSVAADQGYPAVGGGPGALAPSADSLGAPPGALASSAPIDDDDELLDPLESDGLSPTSTGGLASDDDEDTSDAGTDEGMSDEDILPGTAKSGSMGTGTISSGSSRATGSSKSSKNEEDEEGLAMKLSAKFGWSLLATLGAGYFLLEGC